MAFVLQILRDLTLYRALTGKVLNTQNPNINNKLRWLNNDSHFPTFKTQERKGLRTLYPNIVKNNDLKMNINVG